MALNKFHNNNNIILEMINSNKKDVVFLKQIDATRPETKELLNGMIKIFEEVEILENKSLRCNIYDTYESS